MIYLLQHTVQAAAQRTPDHPAFVCGQQVLTYAELATAARNLAVSLQGVGVEPGDRVGILLPRCLETAIAIYGPLEAGAVYVPLNPKAPTAYNLGIIEQCGINVLITLPNQRRTLKNLMDARPQVQCIVGGGNADYGTTQLTWEEALAPDEAAYKKPRAVATDLAYIIYTSGSTGTPKGIMHSHASGLAFARNAVARYGFTAQDRFGNHAPIYFDISQLAYFASPLVGATAVIASDAETIFPASLGKMMEREKITVWYSVPLALVQLLNSGVADTLDLKTLKWVFYAGEAMAPKFARQLLECLPNTRLGNWYGPAETNVCTCYDLPGPPIGDAPIPIGEVWDNTDRLIVDEQNQPVATGEAGELLIRSSTQMLGYWNLPEQSAKAWHIAERANAISYRYYRTGDLVREDANGILQLVGRADTQVKVRGYRIELGAIERLLISHPHVREAIAFTVPSAEENALDLLAAVVLDDDGPTGEKELLAHLGAHLPPYAVPGKILVKPNFPRTATGKIDRQSIRAAELP